MTAATPPLSSLSSFFVTESWVCFHGVLAVNRSVTRSPCPCKRLPRARAHDDAYQAAGFVDRGVEGREAEPARELARLRVHEAQYLRIEFDVERQRAQGSGRVHAQGDLELLTDLHAERAHPGDHKGRGRAVRRGASAQRGATAPLPPSSRGPASPTLKRSASVRAAPARAAAVRAAPARVRRPRAPLREHRRCESRAQAMAQQGSSRRTKARRCHRSAWTLEEAGLPRRRYRPRSAGLPRLSACRWVAPRRAAPRAGAPPMVAPWSASSNPGSRHQPPRPDRAAAACRARRRPFPRTRRGSDPRPLPGRARSAV